MSSLLRLATFDSVPCEHKHSVSSNLEAKLARMAKSALITVGGTKASGVFGVCRHCGRRGRVKQNRRMYTHNDILTGSKCPGNDQLSASILSKCPAGHPASYGPEEMVMEIHYKSDSSLCEFSGGEVLVGYKGNILRARSPNGWVKVLW